MKPLKFINVPDGCYEVIRDGHKYSLELQSFSIMESLVTIEEYLDWYEALDLINHVEGTYLYFNDVNSTNSIYFDRELNKYMIKEGFQKTPMRGVNWFGALKFAEFYGGRLPTELEWEVCARSGHTEYTYPWGNMKPNYNFANYGNYVGHPSQSHIYCPNEWGLYDMAGNLREWCMDQYYPLQPFLKNTMKTENESSYRVIKGGAWDKTENFLKCSFSEGKWERIGTMSLGFRVVKEM